MEIPLTFFSFYLLFRSEVSGHTSPLISVDCITESQSIGHPPIQHLLQNFPPPLVLRCADAAHLLGMEVSHMASASARHNHVSRPSRLDASTQGWRPAPPRVVGAGARSTHRGFAVVQVADERHVANQVRVLHEPSHELEVIVAGQHVLLLHLQLLLLDGLHDGLLQRLRVLLHHQGLRLFAVHLQQPRSVQRLSATARTGQLYAETQHRCVDYTKQIAHNARLLALFLQDCYCGLCWSVVVLCRTQ